MIDSCILFDLTEIKIKRSKEEYDSLSKNFEAYNNNITTVKKEIYNRFDVYEKELGRDYFDRLISLFNPFRNIKHNVAKKTNTHNITNAWLKCYEILISFDLINGTDSIRHFDNASLPGSFILATKYYMATKNPGVLYNWWASSLIGDTALNDEFDLVKNYPNRWMMDDKNKGDVCSIVCINDIVRKLGEGTIDLYTSDLGMYCADYSNKEISHYRANLGQLLLCFRLLSIGGSCIIKQFSFYKKITIEYLFHAAQLFERVYLYKPATSKSYNEEIYIVGINYLGGDISYFYDKFLADESEHVFQDITIDDINNTESNNKFDIYVINMLYYLKEYSFLHNMNLLKILNYMDNLKNEQQFNLKYFNRCKIRINDMCRISNSNLISRFFDKCGFIKLEEGKNRLRINRVYN